MTRFRFLTAITGGIGAGKSIVSRIVRCMGYPVYDCDSRARVLMDNSRDMISRISAEIDEACVPDGCVIDRGRLSQIVFADKRKLAILNDIVHGAVRDDLAAWAREVLSTYDRAFVETAVLYESRLDRMVGQVWEVWAPREVRIGRVMVRNSCTRAEVESRMSAQRNEMATHHYLIVNDGVSPVLPQVVDALGCSGCRRWLSSK